VFFRFFSHFRWGPPHKIFQGQFGSDLTSEYRRHIYGLRLYQVSALHLENSRSSGYRNVPYRRTFGFFRDFFRDFGSSVQGKGAWQGENFFRANARKNSRRRYVLRCHVTCFVFRPHVTEHGAAYVLVGCRVFNEKLSFACRSRVLPTTYAIRVDAVRTSVVHTSRPAFNVRQHMFRSSVLEA